MDIFFDTTVLVAASSRSHPHHAQAFPAVRRVAAGRDRGFISAHSIAEVYASLTRLPVRPRIHPVEAARIVTDNLSCGTPSLFTPHDTPKGPGSIASAAAAPSLPGPRRTCSGCSLRRGTG